VWNLVLIQGLPLFILGAVNHTRTLEIIGFALLVLFIRTGWAAEIGAGTGGRRVPSGAGEKSPDDDAL